jgi:hypothetical protein
MPSTSLINLTADMVFDLNGRKNKTVTRLIDGNLLTKIDASGTSEDAFVLPYLSVIVLPNIYGNMKFEVWESFGSGGTFTVRLYNAAWTLLGTYGKAKSAFNSWQVNNPATVSTAPLNGLTMEQHTAVRFVEIYLPLAADLNIGDFELRLYGDVTGAAESIFPGTEISSRTDPGRYGHGINNIDDRLQEHLTGSPSTYLMPLMGGSVRVGFEGSRFDIYPGTYSNPLDGTYFDLGRFGSNHIKTRVFDFTTPRDIEVQFYHGGGSIKNLSSGEAATSNNEYHPEVNDYRYTEVGADPELLASWEGKAELIYNLIAIYGNNAAASLVGKIITGGTATAGQGGLKEMEVGNEINRDWAGTNPYHTPLAYYLLLKACYDRAQDASSGVRIAAPAVTFMDLTYWRALYLWHVRLYGKDTPFPADILNMNLYLNSDLDGQAQSGSSTGLNPEAWGLHTRLGSLNTLFDQLFPNIELYVSEYGFASFASSPYDVPAIGSKTTAQVSGDIALRAEAIFQLHPFVQKCFYYAFFEDGTGPFNSMAATAYAPFTPGYNGNTVYPVGYCLANKFYVEKTYNYHGTLIENGGTTGAWITRKDHPTDPLKKLFKIWRGTMNGTTSVETVTVGPNAASATLYTLRYNQFTPSTTTPSIVGEGVDVTATEGMQWLEVTYTEAGNSAPVASAGADQTITLPTSSVTVNGSGSTDSDGEITTYAWTKISGPSTFTITSPSSVSTTITGLFEGTYVFRLTVTDDDLATDTDDITITVNPANVAPTAAAGSDQSITLPTDNVTVNGSSSSDPDGTISTYAWSYVSGPVVYTITSPSAASTTITGLIAGVYVFRLTVTDDDGATGTDDVQITVNDAPGNISPVADAGVDQSITLPVNFVTVDGSSSSDVDGTIASYSWIKASGPGTYTITSPTTAITTITGLIAGTYVFRLTVTDDDGAVHSDDVTIEVNPATPTLPSNASRKLKAWWKRIIFRRH